jgi:hypothetical protein
MNPVRIILSKAGLAFCCAGAYFLVFNLNTVLFSSFEFTQGVHWIFLPSGLRMLFVLVLGGSGAVGIATATCLTYYLNAPADQQSFSIVTGLISGIAPLLARQICVDFWKLDPHLSNLTSKSLVQISLVFGVTSALLHQLWFYWSGLSENFIANSVVLAVGDWVGIVIVLATASLLIKLYKTTMALR